MPFSEVNMVGVEWLTRGRCLRVNQLSLALFLLSQCLSSGGPETSSIVLELVRIDSQTPP